MQLYRLAVRYDPYRVVRRQRVNTLYIHFDGIVRLLYYVFLLISLTYGCGVAKDGVKNYTAVFERKHLV